MLYVGKKNGPDAKWVGEAGFTFEGISASGFPRGVSLRLFTFGFDFLSGFKRARQILDRFKPTAVFSTGGYVSVPVSLVAALRGVPVALLEPNIMPGLAAKFSALFSKRIFVGFEDTIQRFSKGRVRWTGIPVREEIVTAQKRKAREDLGLDPDAQTLLMLGGSQGARALNRTMAEAIRSLGERNHPVQVIMMTGWNDYQKTADQLGKCTLKVVLRPFISNIHEAYAAADLVVARSGALTCAEVLSRGLPALFIPYPHASGHQEMNARSLEKAGAAVVMIEKELEKEKLFKTLIDLLSDDGKLKAMGESAMKLARPNAASDIAKELLRMAETE